MAEKIRAALIGIGVMGKKYAEMIVSGEVKSMLLTAVVVRRREMLDWAENLTNVSGEKPTIYASADELYANPDGYDAVIIVTPHKTHEELSLKAFSLGKHVLCDKPAGVTVGQAENMYRAAEEKKRIYGMIFHQHKYPKYIKMKQLIESGELGTLNRVMLVNSRYFRTRHYHKSGSWRSSWIGEGGGALMNQGAHLLDIWQWLFGMPQTVYAEIPFGKYNDFEVDDEATVIMHYDNNMTGVFMLTTGEAVWEERLEVVGSKGKLLLEDNTLRIWKYNTDALDYMKQEQVTSREKLSVTEEVIEFEKAAEPYPRMLEEFAQAVIHEDASMLTAPGKDAVNQITLTNAAYYSAWNHRIVMLPLDASEYEKALEQKCAEERK